MRGYNYIIKRPTILDWLETEKMFRLFDSKYEGSEVEIVT